MWHSSPLLLNRSMSAKQYSVLVYFESHDIGKTNGRLAEYSKGLRIQTFQSIKNSGSFKPCCPWGEPSPALTDGSLCSNRENLMVWDSIKDRPLWLRCTAAVLVAVLAAAIRLQFLEILQLRAAFLTFYPAVAVAALYGGLGAGLLATVVSAALANYFWIEPVGQFAIANIADVISLVIFLASCALISYLAEMTSRGQARTKAIEVQAKLAVEQEFHSFVKEVGDYAIFMLDTAGGVVSWNMGAEQIKGYQADEIIGCHLSCFYTPEDNAREWPDQLLHRAASAGRVEDEGWRVRKDGSRFWANVVLTAVHDRDGSLQEFSKITRDITERNRAEAALQESQGRLAVELAAISACTRSARGL